MISATSAGPKVIPQSPSIRSRRSAGRVAVHADVVTLDQAAACEEAASVDLGDHDLDRIRAVPGDVLMGGRFAVF